MVKLYIADNGTTKAVWHGGHMGNMECAWSSDNVQYALYLNTLVADTSTCVTSSYVGFFKSDGLYPYASYVCSIGKSSRKLLGWNDLNCWTIGSDNAYMAYITVDSVSFTNATVRYDDYASIKYISNKTDTNPPSSYYASRTDLKSAGFSSWGISNTSIGYGAYNKYIGTLSIDSFPYDDLWDEGYLYSYNYIADGNKVEVPDNAVTITTLSTVETGGRAVELRCSDEGAASLYVGTTLYGIADGTLTDDSKKALASDTNRYDIGAIFNDRNESSWQVHLSDGYTVVGWYNAADDTEFVSTSDHYLTDDNTTLYVNVKDTTDINVYAKVVKASGTATISVVGDGSVAAQLNGEATEGTNIAVTKDDILDLTLTPGTNSIVSSVTADGEEVYVNNDNTASITIVNGDTNIVVTFVERAQHELKLYGRPINFGTVKLMRNGETVQESKDGDIYASIYDGITYDLVATPISLEDGTDKVTKFSGWFEDDDCTILKSKNAKFSLAFTSDAMLIAKFEEVPRYSVTASVGTLTDEDAGGCEISYTPSTADFSDGKFLDQRVMTFIAIAGTGWEIYGWEVNGEMEEDASNTRSVTINGADITVKAIFKHSQYTFAASFDSVSSDKGGSIVRERYNKTSQAWETLSDNDILYYGDKVRARIGCGDYVLGRALSNGVSVGFTKSGTEWTVTFDALANNIDLVLYMAGKLKVTLSLVTDGDATAIIYAANERTVTSKTSVDNGTIEAYVLLGSSRRIATKKVTSDTTIGWDGWMLDGSDTPIDGLAEDCYITMTGAEQSYKTSWSGGDKSIYVKVTKEKDSALLGNLTANGGEVITRAAYAAALNGFDVDGDLESTIYLKLAQRGAITVSVEEVGDARFRQWTVSSVKSSGGTSTTTSTVVKKEATFSYYCSTHSVFTAHFAEESAKRVLKVFCDGGEVSFSPSGKSRDLGDGSFAATFYTGDVVSISVLAPSGKCFAGLFTNSDMTEAHDGTTVMITDNTTLWAKLEDDTHAVFSFGAGDANKTAHWRSKLFVATRPWSPTAMRVEADAYSRLKVRVLQATSPDKAQLDEFDERAKPLTIKDQNQRRIALRRPEKHIMVDIETNDPVSTVMVASSSGGLAL